MGRQETLDWIERGETCELRGEIRAAESCYRYALAASPGEPRALFCLANLLWRQNRLDEAKRQFEELLAAEPNAVAEGELLIIKGRLALRDGDWQEAYEFFESVARTFGAAQRTPQTDDIRVKALEGMGNAKYRQGQPHTALLFYRRAVALATRQDSLIQLHNLAHCLANTGRRREAARVFRRALKLEGDADCLQGLGDIYADWERWKQAAECYRKALALSPNDPDIHFSLGITLHALGENDASRLHLERAASLGSAPAEELIRDLDLAAFLAKKNRT